MIHISLRPDNSIKKIDYSHYGKKCILRDEVAVIEVLPMSRTLI